MSGLSVEPIIKRIRQLHTLVSSGGLEAGQHGALVGQEGLLDALLVLYEECNKDYLKREENITTFINKYRSAIHEVRTLRVNLNDFEQKKVIGKGQFGVVQVVREKATGNVYALKTLRKSDTLSQKHVTFYEEERDILAKATSPWMTHLQYAFQDAQQLYLVMDFHPGGDLLSLLDRYDGIFTEEMTCFYLAEIILALHDMHSMGYVHRDVKPDNILVDRCGHIKLADFGSAARLTSSGVVRSKMPVGTPDYIAPEVLQSVNEKDTSVPYGTECDMWSLGIMMYEMLYGFTPFKGDQVVTTYSNIMNYKKTLKFDDKEKMVSETAKALMRGLLEESTHRLTHSGLLQHKFFLHINWNDLRNTVPPFVPVVNGLDDTSNFEEFENERRMPSVDAFCVPQSFSGKNLPFVGFTYNRQKPEAERTVHRSSTTAINISILDESLREPSQLETQLKIQKKENHELKLKLQAISDGEGGRHLKLKESRLKEAEMRLDYLEKERQRLEEENIKKERETANYKRDLATERADRAKTEREVIELIKDMKKKWKDEAAKKIEDYDNKLNACEGEIAFLKSQHQEVGNALLEREKDFQALMLKNKELKKTIIALEKAKLLHQKKPDQCSGGCDAARALEAQLKECSSRLEKEKVKSQEAENRAEEAVREASSLEKTLLEKTQEEGEKAAMEDHIQELSFKITKLEEELQTSTKKFQDLKDQEHQEKKKRINHLEGQLTREKEECSRLRQQLQNVSCQLNESIASLSSLGSTRSLKEEEQEAKIRELEKELKTITGDKVNLQSQLMLIKAKEGEHTAKISELEQLLTKLGETVTLLEGKKHSSESCEETFKAKLECLETQLDSARSALTQEKERREKLADDLKKAKQELSDSKLDLRVAEREAKATQDTIAFLREKSREQRTQLGEKEGAIQNAAEVEANLLKTIEKLEAEIKSRETDMDKQQLEHKLELSKLEEKIGRLEEAKKSGEQQQRKLQETFQQMDNLKLEKRGLESQIKQEETAKSRVEQEKSSLRQEICELQKKLQQSELMISQLKQVCSDQDEELSQMEAQADTIRQLSQEEARLNKEVEKLQADVRAAKASANEEKSLKLFQERKVKELERQLREADAETDQQVVRLSEQLKEEEEAKQELQHQNETLDQELSEAMVLLKNLERRLQEVQGQRDLTQQECAGHIEHIHTLKESNFKLTEGLEEAISKAELYKGRIEEVERTLVDHRALQEDTRVRMQGTIDQQTKLIDFLQSKMDSKKKKNLKDKWFGKENKENFGFSMPHQYRELEELLARERATNRRLEKELAKARAGHKGGVMDGKGTPRGSCTPQLPSTPMPPPSPWTPRTPQTKRPPPVGGEVSTPRHSTSRQRMRHSIPHRWQLGLQMHGARCAGCLGSIPFARSAAKCQECGTTAHIKCSQELPSTCGLPMQFAEHLSKGRPTHSPEKRPSSWAESPNVLQGWLKMPRSDKSCWESCYICLEKETVLVYDKEPSSNTQARARVCLTRPGCTTTVMSTVPRSELPNTSSVDLPYILKVEIRAKTAAGPSDTLYLMTTNFEEKQTWVTALESVVAQLSKEDGNGCADEEYIQVDCLLALDQPSPLDVNTMVYLGQATVVIGAAEGLYSFLVDDDGKLKSRSRIEGLTNVHQIVLVKSAGVALLIAGKDNLVYMIDTSTLTLAAEAMQLTKPSISPMRVEPLQGCHLLAAGTTKAGQTFMCAASSDRICILLWKELEDKFSLCNQYSTQEPCSCLYFTQASLIVGAEKFYEIDLKTFEIEEFLDESDASLAYAIYGSAQMSSFPVAIIQVSKPGKHEEYLLCFHEFAVFVDPYGQRSREHDIKFTRLPIAIEYRSPFLYIIHQNAIEVVEICADSFTKSSPDSESDTDASPPVRMASRSMPRPLFIGSALTPEGIMVACRSTEKLEVTQVETRFPEDMELNSTWGTLPSYSLKLDDRDSASIASSSSIDTPERDMGLPNKRVQFKHNSRTSTMISKSEM